MHMIHTVPSCFHAFRYKHSASQANISNIIQYMYLFATGGDHLQPDIFAFGFPWFSSHTQTRRCIMLYQPA